MSWESGEGTCVSAGRNSTFGQTLSTSPESSQHPYSHRLALNLFQHGQERYPRHDYRKKAARAEVDVNEECYVIKLACPYQFTPASSTWYPHPRQVRVLGTLLLRTYSVSGTISARSNYPSGYASMNSDYMRACLTATWTRSNRATPRTTPVLEDSSIENSNPACVLWITLSR